MHTYEEHHLKGPYKGATQRKEPNGQIQKWGCCQERGAQARGGGGGLRGESVRGIRAPTLCWEPREQADGSQEQGQPQRRVRCQLAGSVHPGWGAGGGTCRQRYAESGSINPQFVHSGSGQASRLQGARRGQARERGKMCWGSSRGLAPKKAGGPARLWNPTCTLPTGAASAAHRASPPPPGSRILLSLMPAHKLGTHHSQADPGGGQLGEGGVLVLVLHFLQLLPGVRGERREVPGS